MNSILHIGSKSRKKEVKDIVKILEAISLNGISDRVGVEALKTYKHVRPVENVTVSNCTFNPKPEFHMSEEDRGHLRESGFAKFDPESEDDVVAVPV